MSSTLTFKSIAHDLLCAYSSDLARVLDNYPLAVGKLAEILTAYAALDEIGFEIIEFDDVDGFPAQRVINHATFYDRSGGVQVVLVHDSPITPLESLLSILDSPQSYANYPFYDTLLIDQRIRNKTDILFQKLRQLYDLRRERSQKTISDMEQGWVPARYMYKVLFKSVVCVAWKDFVKIYPGYEGRHDEHVDPEEKEMRKNLIESTNTVMRHCLSGIEDHERRIEEMKKDRASRNSSNNSNALKNEE